MIGWRAAPGPRRAGFTLAELVVVVTLVGVLAGVAVPTLSHLGGMRGGMVAVRLRSVVAFAQEWAMGTERSTWVVFDPDSDAIAAFVEDPASPGAAGRMPLRDPLTLADLLLDLRAEGVDLVSADFGGTTELEFDAAGAPRDANRAALAADGTAALAGGVTVRVTRNTGLATVE